MVVEGGRVPAIVGTLQPAAAGDAAVARAEARHVEGGACVCGEAAGNAARAIVPIEERVVVARARVGTAVKPALAEPVVERGARVVVGPRRVGAADVEAKAGPVGLGVVVGSRQVHAADDHADTMAGQRRRRVVVARRWVEAALVQARAAGDVGHLAVVVRCWVHAAGHRQAAHVVPRRARVVLGQTRVGAASDLARLVVHDEERLVVETAAVRAAHRRRGRGRRR